MLNKSIVGALILAVAVPLILLGGIYMRVFAALVACLGSYEILSLKKKPSAVLVAVFTVFAIVCGFVPGRLMASGLGIFLIFLIVLSLVDEDMDIGLTGILFLVMTILVLSIASLHEIYQNEHGNLIMIYIVLACYGCDTGAYFFGSAFGRHKMIPRVSPNKSWEGAVGGYLTGAVLSVVYAMFFLKEVSIISILGMSLTLPLIGEVGDLAFSLIKRHYGIKDYGSLLPGHGGILDRLDSLLFCLLFFYMASLFWRF